MKPQRKIEPQQRVRGTGRVYLRGKTWWHDYYRHGIEIRESSGTGDYGKAVRLLNSKIEKAKSPEFVGPSEKKLGMDDLEAKITADYQRGGKKSLKTAIACLKSLKAHFKFDKLLDITPLRIEAYTQKRLDDGYQRSTIWS